MNKGLGDISKEEKKTPGKSAKGDRAGATYRATIFIRPYYFNVASGPNGGERRPHQNFA
jgi:hypothetical protein